MKAIESDLMMIIDGSIYRVLPIATGIKDGFKKGYAYHVKSYLDNRVYPFIDKLKDFKKVREMETPGIYVNKETGKFFIVYPPIKESHKYHIDKAKQISDDTLFENVDFYDTGIDLNVDGDVFKPRINIDDDMNNKIFKTALLLKKVNFDSYKNRFNSIDKPTKKGGSKSTNLRNNSKRAIIKNRSLSSAKLREYSEVFDLDYAIIINDKDDAVNPMSTDGKPIVIFSGDKFDISDCIDVDSINYDELYGADGPTDEDEDESIDISEEE